MTTNETVFTTFDKAINWLKPNLILCNNINDIDETLLDNARFELCKYDEETGEEEYTEIYQYYLTDLNSEDVSWLERNFADMLFTYSEVLELYVLCLDHVGTAWDYVSCEVLNDNLANTIKERKETYHDLTGY